MTLGEELQWRGFIKDKTFNDLDWLNTPRTFYLGTDCSAGSLAIGNLAIYMLARKLRKAGWKTVLLVGGATSLIGDPGGKFEERQLKSIQEIAQNVASIQAQVARLFDGEEFTLVNNYDWFKEIGFLDFLRDVGKHFAMSELINREFISERLGDSGNGISYAEFSYTLIQGYDFWHLFKTHGVVLQIGGSDQWGNMLSGVPLVRKKEGQEVHALSMPLVVNKVTGKKFGKSEEGAVWLDAAQTSPTQFYQFWINVDDEDIEDYIKIYTELDRPTIEAVLTEHAQNPKARLAQRKVAQEVTRLVHGAAATELAEAVTAYLTGQTSIGSASDAEIDAVRKEIPAVAVSAGEATVVDALLKTGLATSLTDARRLLKENAISVNGQKITRESFEEADFKNNRLLLRRGKAFKDSALIER